LVPKEDTMKRFLGWVLALAGLAGGAVQAQDAMQTWQGTLHLGQQDLRLVLQASNADGVVKGRLFSIDQQDGRGMGTSTMSLQDGVLKFTIVGMDASYEGKIGPDGKSAVGTWKQGGREIPLTLEHVAADAAWEIPKVTAAMSMMDPKIVPGYEVATIKSASPDERGMGFTLRGRHFATINTTTKDLIMMGYSLQEKQVIGGPDWMATDHYDLDVLPDAEGLPSIDQSRAIVRKILADRFGLKFHEDSRELSVYVLTVAKTGAKFSKSGSDPNSPPGLGFRAPGRMMVRNATMAEFAQVMEGVMDRPVLDQTGLKDRYDFQLNWTPDESQFGGRVPPQQQGSDSADAPPPLFTAIQEQIGLKMDATKAPAKVMVIDGLEKPSAN
jgi:uncharacterized protein (TIGR03435 family)